MDHTESHFDTSLLFPRRSAAFLNLWYRTYEQAREALDSYPDRFLFPYRSQFVVCEASLLKHLEIDTDDPDWARIGHDWVRPADESAWLRLSKRLAGELERFRPSVFRLPSERRPG
jgi:hypothetical protein